MGDEAALPKFAAARTLTYAEPISLPAEGKEEKKKRKSLRGGSPRTDGAVSRPDGSPRATIVAGRFDPTDYERVRPGGEC